jgi:hypothetical protein
LLIGIPAITCFFPMVKVKGFWSGSFVLYEKTKCQHLELLTEAQ